MPDTLITLYQKSKPYIIVYLHGLINKYRVLELLELSVILDNWRCHRRDIVPGQITHHKVLILYMYMDWTMAEPNPSTFFRINVSFIGIMCIQKGSPEISLLELSLSA